MVEWSMEMMMMMMMMVSRPKSNLSSTQREYLVRTTINQSDLFIAKVYVLWYFQDKKGKRLQARIFNPIIHHVSDDDDDDDDDLDWQGKAKQSFLPRTTPRTKFPASREGKIESWGVLSLLGGLCNIVSLEVEGMVWGKRRLLDSFLCSVFLKMEGEEGKGEERKGKQASRQVSRYIY